jgi:hypothetical protein
MNQRFGQQMIGAAAAESRQATIAADHRIAVVSMVFPLQNIRLEQICLSASFGGALCGGNIPDIYPK